MEVPRKHASQTGIRPRKLSWQTQSPRAFIEKTQIYVLLWAGNALRIPYIDIVLPTTSLLQYHVVSSCCWIGRRNIALCTVQHAANALRICMGSGNSV